MLDFQQRRRLKTILTNPLIRILLLLLGLFVAYSAYIRYDIAAEMANRRDAAEREVNELREQKTRLEKDVEYLSNDRGIEGEMRRQFDIALPGEEVIVILDDQATETEATEPKLVEVTPWYQFWR